MQFDSQAGRLLTVVAEDDSVLLVRAQAGDTLAFEQLVERHRDQVFGLAARMLGSPDDAAEIAQETFLAAYRHLPEFRGDSAFGSWVYRIAANYALMRLRHRKVANEVETPTDPDSPQFNERGSLLDNIADWGRDAEGQTLDAELRGAIEQASAGLPEEYREVFVLRDLEGLPYEEIATLTNTSLAAVKSRLHRARLALRQAIDRFYAERES